MEAAPTDARQQQDRAYWYRHIKAWEAQECSVSDYCRQHRLSEQQFNQWKSSYLKDQNSEVLSVDFIPVVTTEPSEKTSLPSPSLDNGRVQIQLPNGISLQTAVNAPGPAIADLVKSLMPLSC